jgi:uncharacterized protein YecE (DUF72 family)
MTETHDLPTFFIGTSGWTYDHWRGCFYPQELAKSRWFDFYASRFNAVEINATFYRTFKDQTYLNWKARAPQKFSYVLKAPKTITHRKLLRDVETDIQEFSRSAALLGEKFGMILLQVAPSLPYDTGLLLSALQAFTDPRRVAVEFRHRRWYNPEIENLLSSVGAAFCNVDSPRQALTEILTSDRAYLRLHGHEQWYASDYSGKDLRKIADLARRLAVRGARKVYIFFNNDIGGYAPANALTLQQLLSEIV